MRPVQSDKVNLRELPWNVPRASVIGDRNSAGWEFPQSGGLVVRNLSPQTSETFRSRKCLENLPRVMIRIIKTKIFGRQTKAKGAMFFIRCFLDRGFLWGLSYEGPRAVRL